MESEGLIPSACSADEQADAGTDGVFDEVCDAVAASIPGSEGGMAVPAGAPRDPAGPGGLASGSPAAFARLGLTRSGKVRTCFACFVERLTPRASVTLRQLGRIFSQFERQYLARTHLLGSGLSCLSVGSSGQVTSGCALASVARSGVDAFVEIPNCDPMRPMRTNTTSSKPGSSARMCRA